MLPNYRHRFKRPLVTDVGAAAKRWFEVDVDVAANLDSLSRARDRNAVTYFYRKESRARSGPKEAASYLWIHLMKRQPQVVFMNRVVRADDVETDL